MKRSFALFVSAFLISSLVACNLTKSGTPQKTNSENVVTRVAMTLTAVGLARPQQTATVSLTASPTVEQPTNTKLAVLSSPTATLTLTLTPTITLTLRPSNTPIPKPGSIEGSISGYPYGSLPKLAIVAFGQEPPYNYSYLITSTGDTFYSMSSNYLIPGKFQLVAYDSNSHKGGCVVIITVISEQTVTCNITNWGGGYPAKPAGVPSP
jgi:hypothetical protein